jgi:hypothetical protein
MISRQGKKGFLNRKSHNIKNEVHVYLIFELDRLGQKMTHGC